jgi:hypothetical protein
VAQVAKGAKAIAVTMMQRPKFDHKLDCDGPTLPHLRGGAKAMRVRWASEEKVNKEGDGNGDGNKGG